MAMTLTPEQEDEIQGQIDRGEASPEVEVAFSKYLLQKRQPAAPAAPPPGGAPAAPPAPARTPPLTAPGRSIATSRADRAVDAPLPPTPEMGPLRGTPRPSSPLYEQILRNMGTQAMARPPLMGEGPGMPMQDPVGRPLPPGQRREQNVRGQDEEQWLLREILQFAPSLFAPLWAGGAPAMSTFATKMAWLKDVLTRGGLSAATTYGIQDLANRAANFVDPKRYADPELGALVTATGDLIGSAGSRGVPEVFNAGKGLLRRTFGETAEGIENREVLEGLGARAPLAIQSEKRWPYWIDKGMHLTPFGGRLSDLYEYGQQQVDKALKAIKTRHGAVGKVTAYGDDLLTRVGGRADEALLDTTPELLRRTFPEQLDLEKARLAKIYSDVDARYLSEPVPWTLSGRRHTPWRLEDLLLHPTLAREIEDPAASLFGRTVQLMENMEAMAPQVTLDTAIDLNRTIEGFLKEAQQHMADVKAQVIPRSNLTQSIEQKLIPELGKALGESQRAISPHLVDLQWAQEHAAKLVGPTQTPTPGILPTSEAVLQHGQAGRYGLLDDPHISVAKDLLEQPRFVTFLEAHQIRSKLLEVSRLPGLNLGNKVAEEGKQMAQNVANAMQLRGRTLNPALMPDFINAQGAYKEAAENWNSELIMQNMGYNLDDLMTQMIKNERPNDFKTLRAVLGKDSAGNDVFDQAAEMWLTRKILGSRSQGLQQVQPRALLAELDGMTDVAMKELFPSGMEEVTGALRKLVNMEDAISEIGAATPDARKLLTLKNAIDDPNAWHAIQADLLADWLRHGKDVLDGDAILNNLTRLQDVRTLVFDPAQLRELSRLAQTAKAIDKIHGETYAHWSPVVRKMEHGIGLIALPVAAAWMTGDWRAGAVIPATYILTNAMMGRLLTSPKFVNTLAQGMRTPSQSKESARVVSRLLAEAAAHGFQDDVIQIPMPPMDQPGP